MSRWSITVPAELAASQLRWLGDAGRDWIEALPGLTEAALERWSLIPDGALMHGAASLVLPVIRPNATAAVLKLQPPTDENEGEALGLRGWAGDGAVWLLDHDPTTGDLLLERLDAARPLSTVPDVDEAVQILAELMARLVAVRAPSGLRRLADIAAGMLEQVGGAERRLRDAGDRVVLRRCAGAVAELMDEPGDQLLHWDLHYDNVLAGRREPWLAIDPKPLAGDPGFELLPALWNRWEEVTASSNVARAVRRRFDRLTEVVGLDRHRAIGWTLGRVLQNALWDIENGDDCIDPVLAALAGALTGPAVSV